MVVQAAAAKTAPFVSVWLIGGLERLGGAAKGGNCTDIVLAALQKAHSAGGGQRRRVRDGGGRPAPQDSVLV
eukprot:SAG11_NODE_14168_length_622_cov_1.495220_1_plen_71_part_10